MLAKARVGAAVFSGLALIVTLTLCLKQAESPAGSGDDAVASMLEQVTKASLDASVVQKISAQLETGKKKESKSVHEAALDIAKVISEGRKDELSVKQVLHQSRTHHGTQSAALALAQEMKQLHREAEAKLAGVDKGGKAALKQGKNVDETGSAVDAALDLKHAGKQAKEAQAEALAIEKVLQESKKDVSEADGIEQHSETGKLGNNWNTFWSSRHSLVSRLAREVGPGGGGKAASK